MTVALNFKAFNVTFDFSFFSFLVYYTIFFRGNFFHPQRFAITQQDYDGQIDLYERIFVRYVIEYSSIFFTSILYKDRTKISVLSRKKQILLMLWK